MKHNSEWTYAVFSKIVFISLLKALKTFIKTCPQQNEKSLTIVFKLYNLCIHISYSFLYVRL